MKKLLSGVLALALVPLSACAPKVNDPADVQAVKQTVEAYAKGFLAQDAPASVAMMTDKTAFFEPHMPAMTGKDAVAKFHQMLFDQFNIEITPVVTDVQVEGSIATMHGTYTQKLIPKGEGAAAMPDRGNWTVAARRQADGSWKWDWIMGASDQPMPGTTPDGAEEQAVMQLERDAASALLKRDMVFLERGITKEWIKRIVEKPMKIERETRVILHCLGRIPEHGNRWLRVVTRKEAGVIVVITAFFDRRVK